MRIKVTPVNLSKFGQLCTAPYLLNREKFALVETCKIMLSNTPTEGNLVSFEDFIVLLLLLFAFRKLAVSKILT